MYEALERWSRPFLSSVIVSLNLWVKLSKWAALAEHLSECGANSLKHRLVANNLQRNRVRIHFIK